MSTLDPFGPAGLALASLDASELEFLTDLEKAELHAHLNGCIPLNCLKSLAQTMQLDPQAGELVQRGLAVLKDGAKLDTISDFFDLFPAIYALTSTPSTTRIATAAVLDSFLGPIDGNGSFECTYIELRTTPRATPEMSRRDYLNAVIDVVSQRPNAALIVSIDRRMDVETAKECVELAIDLRSHGKPVVGIDLCGDPLKGDMGIFKSVVARARGAGLGITAHIAEEWTVLLYTSQNSLQDSMEILGWQPSRLGHATFLDSDAEQLVIQKKITVEICLSSNMQSKTVPKLSQHHIHAWLKRGHPIVICTDDTLPFQTTLTGEYALLFAKPPLGLGFTKAEISDIARRGFESKFAK